MFCPKTFLFATDNLFVVLYDGEVHRLLSPLVSWKINENKFQSAMPTRRTRADSLRYWKSIV
jgi:hypothetical protein